MKKSQRSPRSARIGLTVGPNRALSGSIGSIGSTMIGLPPMVAASKRGVHGCGGQEKGGRKVVTRTSLRGGMEKTSRDGRVRPKGQRGGQRWYIEKRRVNRMGRL